MAIDTVTLNSSGAALSVAAAVLVAALAGVLDWAARRAAEEEVAVPTEKSSLNMEGKVRDEVDPLTVRIIALVGSVVVLGISSLSGWLVQQVAPLATAAIGMSLLFTLRPVIFPVEILSLNMATAPWLCIIWQLALGTLPRHVIVHGILGEPHSEILPWTMLITFVGAVYMCTSLETTGGPSVAANTLIRICGESRSQLFVCLAVMASFCTVLIPDDVVTMTLAPTICLLCTKLKIDAEPHLYAQFYCANIFAVTLITGNITNVLIAGVTGDEFVAFAQVMLLPGLVGGVCAVLMLYYTLAPQLQSTEKLADSAVADQSQSSHTLFKVRALTCVGRLVLAFTVAAFDSVHRWPIWATIGIFAAASVCIDLGLDAAKVDGTSTQTWQTVKGLPFELFFFFPALFILAQQLVHAGLVDSLAGNMAVIANSPVSAMVFVGFVSMFAAQAVSTAPMTIIFLQVITRVPGWENPAAGTDYELARNLSLYALVLGSNFCGNVSRMGTLGGQMWFKIAGSYDIHLSHGMMVRRSLIIMTPVMALALLVLRYTYHLAH